MRNTQRTLTLYTPPPDPAPEDYPLFRGQTALLSATLRLVARDGYRYHHVQTTPEEKVLSALRTLHEKHHVLISPRARALRRKAGIPVAQVLLGPIPPGPQGGKWPFVLLADRPLRGEHMADVRKKPLLWVAYREGEWRPTYRLGLDEKGDWTWYLTEDFHRELLEKALALAHEGDWPGLIGHLKAVTNLPMFRGVWQQVRDIFRRVKGAWGNRHLRSPEGQWKTPPWRRAEDSLPKTPLSPIGMRLYREEPPLTLGEWLEMKTKGA